MKKALAALVLVILATALLHGSSLAQAEGKKIRLVTRETSLGKVHPGTIEKSFVVSPDSKRVAYGAWLWLGGKQLVVVDGVKGKEYDGILKGSELIFDSPRLLHTLALRGNEIFRVEIEIVE